MQTNFTLQQLRDTGIAHSEQILRKCVHCGFCTATCPTYLTLGDELDSPRGRIYLIKDMLENDRAADEKTVKHIDRCLSCLSCMTTCPSGVHYMHLVDHARAHIENTYKRPLVDRLYRNILAMVLPYPKRFRFALRAAKLAKPFAGMMSKFAVFGPAVAMLDLAPKQISKSRALTGPGTKAAKNSKKYRVAILSGCAQQVLDPTINNATIELLTRLGVEVIVPKDETCCGSLVHHMGREEAAHRFAIQNIDAWTNEIENGGLDAIIITASGCGTTIKDYGHMLRDMPHAAQAAIISKLAKDITEFLHSIELPVHQNNNDLTIAYHSACSLQHGQKVVDQPKLLLKNAGFKIKDIAEGHLCCGSAGVYNIMQKEIADQLKTRKIGNIKNANADIVAAGNIGCLTQIADGIDIPVVHTVELLNWAYGGDKPEKLQ